MGVKGHASALDMQKQLLHIARIADTLKETDVKTVPKISPPFWGCLAKKRKRVESLQLEGKPIYVPNVSVAFLLWWSPLSVSFQSEGSRATGERSAGLGAAVLARPHLRARVSGERGERGERGAGGDERRGPTSALTLRSASWTFEISGMSQNSTTRDRRF